VDAPEQEDQVAARANARGIPVCAGHELTGTYGLETRTVSAAINASILPIVERTGGRFYAASDEASIFKAIREIDRLSPGRIDVRRYSVQRPRYAGFALAAIALWLLAALLKLGFSVFESFP